MSEVQGVQGNYCEPYVGTVSNNLPQRNAEIRHFWMFKRRGLGGLRETVPSPPTTQSQ